MTDSTSAGSIEELRRAVAAAFWRAEAIKVDVAKPFALASGNHSPIYINCRLLISDPAVHAPLSPRRPAAFCWRRRRAMHDAVAGGETAGIPYAAYLASRQRPADALRAQAGQGLRHRLEGRRSSAGGMACPAGRGSGDRRRVEAGVRRSAAGRRWPRSNRRSGAVRSSAGRRSRPRRARRDPPLGNRPGDRAGSG